MWKSPHILGLETFRSQSGLPELMPRTRQFLSRYSKIINSGAYQMRLASPHTFRSTLRMLWTHRSSISFDTKVRIMSEKPPFARMFLPGVSTSVPSWIKISPDLSKLSRVLWLTMTNTHQNSFDPEQLQRLQPIQFLKSCLKANLRPDGRTVQDSRTIKFDLGSISSAHGSTLVSIGNTSVLCGIKFEIAEPEITKPNQGFIIPNVELGPMCCPKFRSGPPNDESQLLSNRLRDILISSEFVPLGSLVIHPGKSVWVVYVDIVCLSYDGNVFDSIVLSAMLGLKNARIPLVKFDHDRNRVVPEDVKYPQSTIPLSIKSSLYSTSFAIFNETILPDPTLFEEELATGFLTIVLDEDSKIRQIWYANNGGEGSQDNKTGNVQQSSSSYLPVFDSCFQYAKKMLSKNKSLFQSL